MTFATVAAGWFVLEVGLRPLAAAAAVALVLRLLRMRAAAVLHAAWSTVLLAMLVMPVLPFIVPPLPFAVPASAADLLGVGSRVGGPAPRVDGLSPQATHIGAGTTSSQMGDSARVGARPSGIVTGASAARPWLAPVVFAVYAAGVLVSVARLFYGWTVASGLVRRARRAGPIHARAAAQVFESPEVSVPVTVGAIRPVIILPVTWITWDADTLTAILAHESVHVRRRHTMINVTARVNRALFWFHPLAWWLERKLALTAEHVCDDAAARAIAPRRYAAILVDMAGIVRRNGGRLRCPAVGVHGAGLLDDRINRLLRGDALARTSRGRKNAAAVGCVLVVSIVSACRQQNTATPLREDPALATRIAEQAERTRAFEAARDMPQAQAETLEQRIALDPEDVEARRQLIAYYRTSSKVTWDKKVPGLRRHALWLIEHHPEHPIEAPPLSPEFDPDGFAAAKRLWEAHLAKPDVAPFLIYRAATFFGPHDKAHAERLILRGMAMDPDSRALRARMSAGIGGYEWPVQLSSLYAAALRGSESAWGTYNDLRTHADRVNSTFAVAVRETLEATRDAQLLARVGSILARPIQPIDDPSVKQTLEQVRRLGVSYLERALELDPGLDNAKAALVSIKLPGQTTDADRLASRALEGYMVAEDITEYVKKDAAAAKQQRDEAKARAQEVLNIAATHAQDPAYSAAVMTAHHVLATAALRDGARERAVYHMRESVKVPTSERIQYAPTFSWTRPVTRLLREGERERVAEFLEAFAGLTIRERSRLLNDAQSIRDGRMPSFYQAVVGREGR